MGKEVRIRADDIEVTAALNDTRTALAIWEALPIAGNVNLWGDEIYFMVPVRLEFENAQELVYAGDLAYWPQGPAFCIFFGPTPISKGNEIRPASAVNVFGKIIGDSTVLRQVTSGTEIVVESEK